MTNETLKNPTAIVLPNAVGIDLAIKKIQMKLALLPWLEKAFGRAWTLQRTVQGESGNIKRIEPMVYQGTSEYYPVLPNDSLKSYCFFRAKSGRTMTPGQNESGTAYGNYYLTDPVEIIFWFNLQDIDSSKNYIFKEELIRDVLAKLDTETNVRVEKIWDDRVEDIFSGYTLYPEHRDLLMYPFGAFKFDLTLSYLFTCTP